MSSIVCGTIVTIRVFDDGNDKYSHLRNEWKVTELKHGGGKLVLKNTNTNEEIPSISAWKVKILK